MTPPWMLPLIVLANAFWAFVVWLLDLFRISSFGFRVFPMKENGGKPMNPPWMLLRIVLANAFRALVIWILDLFRISSFGFRVSPMKGPA